MKKTTKIDRNKSERGSTLSSSAPVASVSIISPNNNLDSLAGKYENAVAEESAEGSSLSSSTIPGATQATGGPGIITPGTEGKRRGRPPGSKNSPKQTLSETFFMRPMVKAMIAFPYGLAANQWGPHWNLSDEEAERMIDPHLALINKYLPDYIKEHTELYAVILMHGLAVSLRLAVQAQLPPQPKPQRRDKEPPVVMETPGGPSDSREAWFGKVRPDEGPVVPGVAVPAL